ncbi:orotidine 5-phosphate decarboxylase [uncultured Roseovarius sp.]|uniref:orotidine 5-phosphate decarboxylase n=1 Tax=uncultured Roseovarius sp. TaxID=293344 RepID=UPI002635AF4C|nr:orotidine 5-phosphate decarboxylase [uncultured Roseovarius sp.]
MRLLLTLLLALVVAPALRAETRLSENVSLAHGTFSSGGGLTIAAELRQTAQGGTVLCGAWSESASQASYTNGEARRILQLASVSIDGQRVATDLGFMPRVEPQLDYAGTPATCALIDLPWRIGRVPEIFLPRQQITRSGGDNSAPNIVFRQSAPGAQGAALEVIPFLRRNSRLVPLTDAAQTVDGGYSSGGGIRLTAELRPVDGRAHLCGVWSDLPGQDPRTQGLGREMLRRASVASGKELILTDLSELRRATLRVDYLGVQATCLDTGRAWTKTRGPFDLRLPQQVVYRNTTPKGRTLIRFGH